MIQTYVKKPVEIQALVWNNNFNEMFLFMDADNNYGIVGMAGEKNEILQVRTLEGIMDAQIGDYIIKNENGDFHPCKPEVFEMTYEPSKENSFEGGFYPESLDFVKDTVDILSDKVSIDDKGGISKNDRINQSVVILTRHLN